MRKWENEKYEKFQNTTAHFGSPHHFRVRKQGKEKRNMILQTLLQILWIGNVDGAIGYLRSLSDEVLRTPNRIEDLCAYFEKNRICIPCYAIRKMLSLKISSDRVEKANDLAVAKRQKHLGMSWSVSGSGALAQIQVHFINNIDCAAWLSNRSGRKVFLLHRNRHRIRILRLWSSKCTQRLNLWKHGRVPTLPAWSCFRRIVFVRNWKKHWNRHNTFTICPENRCGFAWWPQITLRKRLNWPRCQRESICYIGIRNLAAVIQENSFSHSTFRCWSLCIW